MAAGSFNPSRTDPGVGSFGPASRKRFRRHKNNAKKRQRDRMSRREFMNSPFGQNTLTGREAIREARRAAGYKYGEADRMLGREIGRVPGQQRQIDAAYNLYTQKLGELAGRTQAAYAQAQRAAYNQANQDTAAVQAGAVPGSELSGQVANAAAVRNANTVNFGGMIGAQGASQTAYQNDQRRIGELERIGAHAKETDYERELRAKRRDLKKERGQYRGEVLRQIRDDERQWTLEQVAFEIDKFNAEQDAADARRSDREARRHNKAMERNTRRGQNVTKRGQNITRENNKRTNKTSRENNIRSNQNDGSNGPSNSDREQWENAKAAARRLKRTQIKDGGKKRYPTYDEVLANLDSRYDHVFAAAAAQLVYRGGVAPKFARKLRQRYGLKVKKAGGGGYDQPFQTPDTVTH